MSSKVTSSWEYGKGWTKPEQSVEAGIYETPTGEIFVVKPNRDKTHLYAMKLVESPPRITETGTEVDFDFVYEKGAIFRLKASWRMNPEKAKELTIKYSRCIVCGRQLKAAQSVGKGIGPVCSKFMGGSW